MHGTRFCTAAIVALAAFSTVRAQSDGDVPILAAHGVSDWPTAVTKRPLTLGAGMAELVVPVNINMSRSTEGKPVSINPSLYFGITDRWMIGVRHFEGFCVSGKANGCAKVYNDVSVDTLFSVGRAAGIDLALGLAVNYAPIDPSAWSGEARVVARAGGGALAFTVAPTINFGLSNRESRAKRAATQFDIGGTYNLVLPVPDRKLGVPLTTADAENREFLSIPGTIQLQLGPNLAVSGGIAIEGPVDPSVGNFGDFYRVPVSVALTITPIRWIDLGASFTFPDLIGKTSHNEDFRTLGVFAAFRI
ncbi:hypothetical protein [Anaeromyxobacter oryzisoli]|uniref:hypothetical protein n=1 Tax=Anaeromyxobacter oryzisoli TaxID=2925408 RepID=UPI001F5A99BB|nr:hypothetical protein [Anaeromyxobacter sp. SG63]